ncbi:uncharacterized protein [Lolium perenne]|uniref:uncharacterized protein n=1 Tax=Lolium perenne TaxID=4522 RepID=UPI0021EAE7E0|nr:uncharacterized protein LOC127307655 [Lolium perenne]XP_051194362.1 uncharacterized protein LOC127307655 [Lolium perenne]
MEVVQTLASAVQLVSAMVSAVGALEQAAADAAEAPRRLQVLEDFVSDLELLMQQAKQKHAHKMHGPQLERQFQSLSRLMDQLRGNIIKARRALKKGKGKGLARVVWSSVVGDPLMKYIQLIRDDLNWWLELQKLSQSVGNAIASTAKGTPSLLRVKSEHGYPVSTKCNYVRELLEKDDGHRVVLIVGLSGIGKSCLARQIASEPPDNFVDGAIEISFGRWCSRAACSGSRSEYHKRLVRKICKFLVQIGSMTVNEDTAKDLEDVCCLLQTSLVGRSMLILLDDVWEQDIVDRFTKLYDNDCRYLVTTRDEAVYEIAEAEKVEISKDDIKRISKGILLYHSLLSAEEPPPVADGLLDRCGHHPLTVAVLGKALRKETRVEKWEKAISNLSTYATCAPGPVSYVNEKEVETTLTIFGSFEFSLEAMPANSRRFFMVLAAISWEEPVPEACLESIWSALMQDSLFPIVVSKLVEGSLIIKMEDQSMYHMHDMVSLYLEDKANDALHTVLTDSFPEYAALVAPWLFIFGKEGVKGSAEQKMRSFFSLLEFLEIGILLGSTTQALMACKSISEFEASRIGFRKILGPQIAELISVGSPALIVAVTKAITVIFFNADYANLAQSLETAGSVDKLICVLHGYEDSSTLANVSAVLAKVSEHVSVTIADEILASIPMDRIAELLSPENEEWHEIVFTTLASLIKVGNLKAVERMIEAGVDKKLLVLLGCGSEISQHHAIITLKTFCELGAPLQECMGPGLLIHLPWHARLTLERFVLSDQNVAPSPKPQYFEVLLHRILRTDNKDIIEAIQGLIPLAERANDPRVQDLLLGSNLSDRLAFLLQRREIENNQVRSQTAFLVMKLACTGGEPYVRRFLELDIVDELIVMMQSSTDDLQDSAYHALHQIVYAKGGSVVLQRFLKRGTIEKLVNLLDRKCVKTKDLVVQLLVDIAAVGTKPCIERMLSSKVIEKLVALEEAGEPFSGAVSRYIHGLNMCENIQSAERSVMKQHIMRKVRSAARGHNLEMGLVASVEACISEGTKGASSSRRKR